MFFLSDKNQLQISKEKKINKKMIVFDTNILYIKI